MKEYCDDNNFIRHKRRKKPKRHALRWFISLLLVLCFCLTVMMLAIGCDPNNFSFATDKPPNTHPSNSAVTNTDLNTDSTAGAPGNARELPKIADAGQSDVDKAASTDDEQSNADETAWCLTLINKWNTIPDDYKVELTELANGQSVDKRIYPALQKMFDTARSEGVYPVVVAGYRTAEKQQSLMDKKIAEYIDAGYSAKEAKTKAEAWVAIPGTSEHQLGISVDVGADEAHSTDKEVEEWLKRNSYKFGFIRRYSDDKSEITGVIDEPWHYRYVGTQAATEIYNQGICLEEYLSRTN